MSKITFDANKTYSIEEAAELLPQVSTSKFVGSVEADVVLTIPKKQVGETLKGTVNLPHQYGKPRKVIVFADESAAKQAIKAGAVDAGLDELIKKVENGKVEFDVVVATPDIMAKIAKLGRVLGPRGLMPNPAAGTVTTDVVQAVESFMGGKQNYRMSEQGVVRTKVAKVDMPPAEISANIRALIKAIINDARKFGPQPIRKITVAPTMGPGIVLDVVSAVDNPA